MGKISSRVALVLLAIGALLLIAVNNLVFKGSRFDLTQDRMFSISDGTVATLEGLQSDVNLKFFYSEEQSTELGFLRDYARRITDLLDEYSLRTGAKADTLSGSDAVACNNGSVCASSSTNARTLSLIHI